jgi:GNAT superfamily N-acetyltransferase
MAGIFEPKLTPELKQHLDGIDLQALSRIDANRLTNRAIPNIGSIELVNSSDFAMFYDALYIREFPKRAERERSDLIVTRLAAQFAGERDGLAPYRIVGIRDEKGEAIGAAQFSVLPLSGGEWAVPYLQYIYVRAENRRQDISEVLHTMTLAVAVADARTMGERTVPFTLFETEPPGHGDDEESCAFSVTRAQVHTKGGAVAVVVVKGGEEQISPHVQPGLEVGEPPLSLVWAIRRSPRPGREWRIQDVGRDLMKAYYQSLRDEGFPEENIKLAERIVEERCDGAEWRLIPLDQATFHHA